jgi:hypothetical protein
VTTNLRGKSIGFTCLHALQNLSRQKNLIIECYVTLFYLQYVIQAFCLALGIYMMVEGFRKIQVNRVKQSLAAERLKDVRLREMKIKETVEAVEETLRAGDSDDLAPVA